jgi:hypothetical protein
MKPSLLAHTLDHPFRLLVTGLVATALVGCGGGGASSTTPTAANPGAQTCAKTSAKIGQVATLQTRAHAVAGTATIIDNCTIELRNFSYDGGGLPDVFAYGGKAGNYAAGFAFGKNLFGTRLTNATVTLTLKDGDLDNLDGISIWCIRAGVSFGDGLFR